MVHEHISEEELAELALHGEQLATPVLERLGGCTSCRDAYERYARLRAALTALPSEGSPRADLWARLARRIERTQSVSRSREPVWMRWGRAAVAAGVVTLAFAIGRISASDAPRREADLPTDPYHAAVELQKAGTDYLTILAVLRRLDGPPSVRAQGRAAALATLRGAALELAQGEGPNSALAGVASTLATERARDAIPVSGTAPSRLQPLSR